MGAARRTSCSGVARGSSGRRSCSSRPKRIDGPALRSPSVGSRSPASTRSSTDLPAPLSPTTPTRSPRRTVRLTSTRIGGSPSSIDDTLAAARLRTQLERDLPPLEHRAVDLLHPVDLALLVAGLLDMTLVDDA